MRIVTTTNSLDYTFGISNAVKLICEAGFEGIDLSMEPMFSVDYKDKITEIRTVADYYGVPFTQAHGPIPKFLYGDADGRETFLEKAKRSLYVAGELGIENVVFHPIRFSKGTHSEQLSYNMEVYAGLIPIAKDAKTKIAIENMCGYKTDEEGRRVEHVCKNAEELCRFVDAFDDKSVGACLDTGHSIISGVNPADFVHTLGASRLSVLHIHDSDGKSDLHTLPYTAAIDWAVFINALRDIKYNGDITLEAVCFTRKMPPEIVPEALKLMAKTAEYMKNEIKRKA